MLRALGIQAYESGHTTSPMIPTASATRAFFTTGSYAPVPGASQAFAQDNAIEPDDEVRLVEALHMVGAEEAAAHVPGGPPAIDLLQCRPPTPPTFPRTLTTGTPSRSPLGGRRVSAEFEHRSCIADVQMGIDWLAQPLAFVGLLIGTELYFLLIVRRRRAADEREARFFDESRRKSMSRLRHLRRHDET